VPAFAGPDGEADGSSPLNDLIAVSFQAKLSGFGGKQKLLAVFICSTLVRSVFQATIFDS